MFDFKNILIVAAHPDDEVLGVGGTIPIMQQQGGKVTVLIVTDGSTAQYPGDKEILERKNEHMMEANNILGTDEVIHWSFPDMRLDTVEHITLNIELEQVIREKNIDTVFFHHDSDINLDHQLIYKSVLVAARPEPAQTVCNLLTYPVNSSTEWGARSEKQIFCPNIYVDITSTINLKLDAFDKYTDEIRPFPHPRSAKALKYRARTFGSEAGYEYAEAFRLIHSRFQIARHS